jgi:hypothetical protein
MRIDSGGNVGIGNTAPGYRLSVLFDANAQSQIQIANSNAGASATASIRLETQGNTWIINSNRNGGAFSIQDATTTRVWITNTGDVGIGTNSPGAPLDIRGANGLGVRYIETTTGNTNRIELGTASGSGYVNATAGVGSTALVFQVAGSELVRIAQTGSVGIGTTSPDVFGRGYSGRILGISSAGQSAIELNSATWSAAYFDMGVNAVRSGSIYADATTFEIGALTSSIDLGLTTNGVRRVTVGATTGNVGIGVTSVTSIFGTTIRAFSAGSGATLQLGGTNVNATLFASEGLTVSALGNTTNHPFFFFTNDIERMVKSRKLAHNACPVLRWMARNARLVFDSNGNKKLDKDKSSEKIDGLVALCMAQAARTYGEQQDKEEPSIYEERGVRTI